jgi:hypothetical protein
MFTIPSKYNSLEKVLKIFGFVNWKIISSSMNALIAKGVDAAVADVDRVASLEASKVAAVISNELSGVDPSFAVELESLIADFVTKNVDKSVAGFAVLLKAEIARFLGVSS